MTLEKCRLLSVVGVPPTTLFKKTHTSQINLNSL